VNIIREYRNYLWQVDKDGKVLNIPEAGFDHCFIGETKIKTILGDKKIIDVVIGDSILTEGGYYPVVLKHKNGVKQVVKYRLQFDMEDDIILVCTPNHKIKTNKGWLEISKLKSGMMVTLSSSSGEEFINSIQRKDTFQRVEEECTLMSGENPMALSKKVFKFTTKMKILGTIPLGILNLLKSINIYPSTLRKDLKTKNLQKSSKEKELKKLKNGTLAQKVDYGIANTANEDGRTEPISLRNVSSVGKNIKLGTQEYQSIAIKTVKLKHFVEEESWKEEVYDLTVLSKHQYFANNVLVHNCMDAIRYAITSLIDFVPDHIRQQQQTHFEATKWKQQFNSAK
jgi:hypothetical protein